MPYSLNRRLFRAAASQLRRRNAWKIGILLVAFAAVGLARGERITGTYHFLDRNLETGQDVFRPIAYATVEIWRFDGQWAAAKTTKTDGRGVLNVNIPYRGKGKQIAVKIYADNYAALVWMKDSGAYPFSRIIGEDSGQFLLQTPSGSSAVLDFSERFSGVSAEHFNLADTVRQGFDYATARRDPRESDVIPRANILPATTTPYDRSYFNMDMNTVVVLTREVYADFLILHEYAHFLQRQIGQFAPLYAYHDGCVATGMDGSNMNSPQHAWMESFANYFAGAVALNTPVGVLSGWGSTFSPAMLEYQPMTCLRLPGGIPAEAVESCVTGALWDLADAPGYGGVEEGHDFLSGNDTLVFQIFDHELDGAGGWPTIEQFRIAWLWRGANRPGIDLIWQRHGFATPEPPPAVEPPPSNPNPTPIPPKQGRTPPRRVLTRR